MQFSDGTIQSIRSISQRSLATYWQKLGREHRRLPAFGEFHPEPRTHDPKQMAIWKVERNKERPVLLAMYRGSLIDEAFNEGWIGKTLEEVTPPLLKGPILAASDECVRSGCAIYSILRTSDGSGAAIDLERLLLPFGDNGRVDHVVASLQLISLKGEFKRSSIVSQFAADCSIMLAQKISMT